MIKPYKASELRMLRERFGFSSDKSMGQNFLVDGNIVRAIADAAELCENDTVIEVGAGVGALTTTLAESAGRVIAIELDKRLVPVLEAVTEGAENIEVVQGDFLKFDRSQIGGEYKLLGNLPYNITTPVIAEVLEGTNRPSLMVFMMQKEVAERLTAAPGGRTYGAISVLVQYHTEAELLFTVSREVFRPRPGVDSAVVRFRKVQREMGVDADVEAMMFRVVKAGFGQRRKTLRNSLKALGEDEGVVAAALEGADIDPGRRAETLGWEDYLRIARYIIEGNREKGAGK